ncbi:hypothetical protein MC885_002387, partial [Smutsia gigantea]
WQSLSLHRSRSLRLAAPSLPLLAPSFSLSPYRGCSRPSPPTRLPLAPRPRAPAPARGGTSGVEGSGPPAPLATPTRTRRLRPLGDGSPARQALKATPGPGAQPGKETRSGIDEEILGFRGWLKHTMPAPILRSGKL